MLKMRKPQSKGGTRTGLLIALLVCDYEWIGAQSPSLRNLFPPTLHRWTSRPILFINNGLFFELGLRKACHFPESNGIFATFFRSF